MSRSALSVVESSPARMSITVIWAFAVLTLSNTFIWSEVEVMSTTSVMSGWNRRRVPLGDSVSKARVGMLWAIR